MFQASKGLLNEHDTGILPKVFNIKRGKQISEYLVIIQYIPGQVFGRREKIIHLKL